MSAIDLQAALEALGRLPYQKPPYAARNWGDPLHGACSYPSKMKPALAHFLVRLFSNEGDLLLDPFAGSGTLPLEACLQGRFAVGSDLSPLASILTTAKVSFPSTHDVALCVDELATRLGEGRFPNDVPDEIRTFYHPRTLAEIVAARCICLERLAEVGPEAVGPWSLVTACILHLLHGNRPYALSRRSHNIIPIPPKGPTEYRPLIPRLRQKIARLRLSDVREARRGKALHGAADALPLAASNVDVIITSPPFLGTTDFLRQNRIRLWFAGWDYERQAKEKGSGTFLEFARAMDAYAGVLSEFRRVLTKQGIAMLHLGVVKGFDMALELQPVAREVGFAVVGVSYETTTHLETQGRTARGATARHAFLLLQNS